MIWRKRTKFRLEFSRAVFLENILSGTRKDGTPKYEKPQFNLKMTTRLVNRPQPNFLSRKFNGISGKIGTFVRGNSRWHTGTAPTCRVSRTSFFQKVVHPRYHSGGDGVGRRRVVIHAQWPVPRTSARQLQHRRRTNAQRFRRNQIPVRKCDVRTGHFSECFSDVPFYVCGRQERNSRFLILLP